MDVALRGTVESAGLNRLALSVWSAQAQHHPETLAYHNGFGHFKPVRAVRRCLLRQVWQCSASLPQLGPQRLPIWASACDDCLPPLRNLPRIDAEEIARRIDEQRNGWKAS
jgi:hypothetical protein